jgi:hypothetical protein
MMGIFTGRPLKVAFARKKAPPKRGLSRGLSRGLDANEQTHPHTPDHCMVPERDGPHPNTVHDQVSVMLWERGASVAHPAPSMMSGGLPLGFVGGEPVGMYQRVKECSHVGGKGT